MVGYSGVVQTINMFEVLGEQDFNVLNISSRMTVDRGSKDIGSGDAEGVMAHFIAKSGTEVRILLNILLTSKYHLTSRKSGMISYGHNQETRLMSNLINHHVKESK